MAKKMKDSERIDRLEDILVGRNDATDLIEQVRTERSATPISPTTPPRRKRKPAPVDHTTMDM